MVCWNEIRSYTLHYSLKGDNICLFNFEGMPMEIQPSFESRILKNIFTQLYIAMHPFVEIKQSFIFLVIK